MTSEKLTLLNRTGLHARPAALLVKEAGKFRSKIRVYGRGKTADAKSILSLMLLAAGNGCEITIEATGDDEAEAVSTITALVRNRFGEDC